MNKIIYYIAAIVIVSLFNGCASTDAFKYVKKGDLPNIKKLIETEEISINILGPNEKNTLFDEAVKRKKFHIADYLLSKGININEISPRSDSCRSTIHKAAWTWSFESLKYLVENGADVNLGLCFSKVTPLMYATNDFMSKYTDLQIKKAKYLLANGADINAKSNHPAFPDIKTSAYSDKMKAFIEDY